MPNVGVGIMGLLPIASCKCWMKLIETMEEGVINMDWTNSRPTDFKSACEFMDYCRAHAIDSQWSIAYWGHGEHFTYWSGFSPKSYGFIDFDIDQGSAITWKQMKEIITESSQALWDCVNEERTHILSIDVDVDNIMSQTPEGKPV